MRGDASNRGPATGLRVKVPGSAIKTSSTYVVSLHEADGAPAQGTPTDARFPASGTQALGAKGTNGPMHLVLVPFRYTVDGSNRLPPMDAATVAAYKSAFEAMYPATEPLDLVV